MNNNIFAGNILIVDDQIVNVKLLEKILKRAGFDNVFSTTDSRQAVSLFQKHNIDALLLDIRMPHLDGFEVMEKLQSIVTNDYLPILVLTAELTSETRSKSLSNGAKDFITKPFDRTEVLQRIQNILEVRLLHKQITEQNVRLEEKVKKRTQELEDSQLEVIQRLGLAAEYKDNETGNHVMRMSKFSQLLGKTIGFSDKDSEILLHATSMHDIGKIGIPDYILLKPGKLNAEEWEIMKTHVTIGTKMLSDGKSAILKLAQVVILTHHEKWDGSGYPNGLAAEAIPVPGRICAISDVFDALTSTRPYKKPWSIEDAMLFIKEQSGKHFDPHLVTIFERILPEILSIRARYMDV